ncbi:MAG TPA: sulfate/molybdate ABC transporter ATP-binding protein [Candidatus Binatia bacterium]|nr:sulfate/molybdate ABC transporter ATP-binding protein [Candidatus Binatia bacterium]
MSITVERVTKRFGAFLALDNVSLDVPGGTLLALLGPSGSGKTTLLRVIAGLEQPDAGSVRYEGQDMADATARERNVGFVFQHYALFRHMSVYENIAFGLRVRHRPRAEIDRRVRELLRLIQLQGIERARPSQLSGGQRQRVALARALAAEPKVLLLDEPFGALDAKVRQDLRQWLRRLHDEIHVTTVFVTHDQEEAFEVADRVVIMNHGQIEQVGSPAEIFEQPANPFVMDFLGNVNVFHGHVERGRVRLGGFEVAYPQHPHDEPKPATAFVRAHDLDILRAPTGQASLRATVVHVNPAGPVVKLRLFAEDFGFTVHVNLDRDRWEDLRVRAGDAVFVAPRAVKVFVHDYQI